MRTQVITISLAERLLEVEVKLSPPEPDVGIFSWQLDDWRIFRVPGEETPRLSAAEELEVQHSLDNDFDWSEIAASEDPDEDRDYDLD